MSKAKIQREKKINKHNSYKNEVSIPGEGTVLNVPFGNFQ